MTDDRVNWLGLARGTGACGVWRKEAKRSIEAPALGG